MTVFQYLMVGLAAASLIVGTLSYIHQRKQK